MGLHAAEAAASPGDLHSYADLFQKRGQAPGLPFSVGMVSPSGWDPEGAAGVQSLAATCSPCHATQSSPLH